MAVRLIPASRSRVRRFLGAVRIVDLFGPFWMTYRLPYQADVTITHPDHELAPARSPVLEHELVHAKDFARWWGPWWMLACLALPLPVFFSGRWFIERHAYLADIRAGRRTVEQAVAALWTQYGWAWPRGLMRTWFKQQLAKGAR